MISYGRLQEVVGEPVHLTVLDPVAYYKTAKPPHDLGLAKLHVIGYLISLTRDKLVIKSSWYEDAEEGNDYTIIPTHSVKDLEVL